MWHHWRFCAPHREPPLRGERGHADPADFILGGVGRWEERHGEWAERLG